MIEAGTVMRDLTLENPIRAIREVSHDTTGRRKVRLASGREASALEVQREYYEKAVDFVDRRGIRTGTVEQVLELWGRTLDAIEEEDLDRVATEIDWVMKYKLLERYRAKHNMTMSHPRVAQIDLAYHDIHRRRGLYYLLEKNGQAARICNDLKIFEGKSVPPQTTRARLRGDFIRRRRSSAATSPSTGSTSSSTTRRSGPCCARTPSGLWTTGWRSSSPACDGTGM